MSEHRARIIASQWLINIAELELVEALTAEALRTLDTPTIKSAIIAPTELSDDREQRL